MPVAVVPPVKPGNRIVPNPLEWHTLIIMALVVGISIWLVEQYVDATYALLLAIIVLLGAAYMRPNFGSELTSIMQGKT